jgi:signal transduction histidine kinase/tetratricopeptide (TPR) repeat protein
MKSKIKYLLFALLMVSNIIYSQQNTADSLIRELGSSDGPKKVDLLNELSDIYQYINTQLAIKYAEDALTVAASINYKKGIANSYGSLGYCYINLNNDKALAYTEKALEIRTQLNDVPGIATSNNVLGVIYYYTGDYLKSIDYHIKALSMREKIGDQNKIATSYNNIALVHIAIENYETALSYLEKALAIRTKDDNIRGIAILNDNIGDIYSKMGQYDKAFSYFNKALVINKQTGNKKSEAYSYYNIASGYQKQNDSTNALKYFNFALDIYQQLDEKNGISNVENGLAVMYSQQGLIIPAITHANLAYNSAQFINSLENIAIASDILYKNYYKLNDYKNAFRFSEIFIKANDRLKNAKNYKRLAKIDFDYKVEKLNKEKEAELNQQKDFIIFLSVAVILLLMIFVLIIFLYRSKRRLNKDLNMLNNKLTESNSAKDRFFSIIAHDLRGPFTGLLGISEYLSNDVDQLGKEEIKQYNQMLNLSLQKQYDLLNDLLEWARLQNVNSKLNYEKIILSDVVNSLISSMQLIASLKNINIINSVDKYITLFADKNMMLLVLRNLFFNGIKFTNKNGYTKISAVQTTEATEILIEDNGVGISEKDLARLLRIDVHHSTVGTANEMGTGLGLILCKEIIDKHSGTIKIESKLNIGTKIFVQIPRTSS